MRFLKMEGHGLLIIIFFILITANHTSAEEDKVSVEQFQSTLKSELRKDGEFINRLRLENGLIRISLSGSVETGEINYIEPYLRTPFLSVGRLNLKGSVREYYNHGSISPAASVFFEPTGITSTDSFSRSSRYGLFIELKEPILSDSDILFWGYKKNAGAVSSGITFRGLPVLNLSFLNVTSDLLLSVSDFPEKSPSGSWFSDAVILPRQIGINGAAELRWNIHPFTGGPDAGAGKGFFLASSLFGGYSLPQYTETGWFLRGLIEAGIEEAKVFSLLQHSDKNYLSPEGTSSQFRYITGAGFELQPALEGSDLLFRAEYTMKLAHELIIPSRYLEQTENMKASMKFTAGAFTGSLRGSYKRLQKADGSTVEDASADIELKIARSFFRMAVDAGYSMDRLLEYGGGLRLTPNLSCIAEGQKLSAGISIDCRRKVDAGPAEGAEYKFAADLNLTINNGNIKIKLGLDNKGNSPELSVGFEQIIRNW